MFKLFNKLKRSRFVAMYKTKELKPKDGYDRFEYMGRIINYKESEIKAKRPVFAIGDTEGETRGFDDDGGHYILSFAYRNKWIVTWIKPIERWEFIYERKRSIMH